MRLLKLLALLLAAPQALHGHGEVTPFPKVIQLNAPLAGLKAPEPHAMTVYRLDVPAGTVSIQVSTAGGTGECDLYLSRGVQPTPDGSVSDYASTTPRNNERIDVANPPPGVWYVGLRAGREAYDRVRLMVRSRLERGALAPVRFSPEPGIYPGPVLLRARAAGWGTTVRYTTDGSDPDADSPELPRQFRLDSSAVLKARPFDRSGNAGPVSAAEYRITEPGTIHELANGDSVAHLAGFRGGRHLFRIDVPANQTLVVQAEGGSGGSSLSIALDQAPPLSRFGLRGFATFGTTRAEVAPTEAGTYYIALDARGSFSHRHLFATLVPREPDLVPWSPTLRPYVSTEVFAEDSCEVIEGHIGAGERRLLRYSTEIRNVGEFDLVLPDPEGNPDFEYHACHDHYHFSGFASSRILDLDGNPVREGRKVSFCLLDSKRWNLRAHRFARYDCDHQGIQAGWGDIYDSGLPGQWIEIGDLPAGDYQLELTVNPDRLLSEANYDNNTVVIPVTIP